MLVKLFLFLSVASFGYSTVINMNFEDCHLVKTRVPERGIVCSNYERAHRLAERLGQCKIHRSSWGPFVAVGHFKGEEIFIASAPIGPGAGIIFTELYAAGAKFILRYGSDDVKSPGSEEQRLVKIIDEADNLYGFNIQSGVPKEEWGKPLPASSILVDHLVASAKKRSIPFEKRICHHLANYHALRTPEKFIKERAESLKQQLGMLDHRGKKASFDMETAVLYRVARDFECHAATVLQTIDKEVMNTSPEEKRAYQHAREIEEGFFFNFVLKTLVEIPDYSICQYRTTANQIRMNAEKLLAEKKILERLAPYAEVFPTGSYALNLMSWNDIDLTVFPKPGVDIKEVFAAMMQESFHDKDFVEAQTINFMGDFKPDRPRGLYLGLKYNTPDLGGRWKIDIFMPKDRVNEPASKLLTRMKNELTEEQRNLILEMKFKMKNPEGRIPSMGSFELYQLVLDRNLGRDELEACLKGKGLPA